ncbi:MAG: hypothetical protein ABIE68_03785 [bacterium]
MNFKTISEVAKRMSWKERIFTVLLLGLILSPVDISPELFLAPLGLLPLGLADDAVMIATVALRYRHHIKSLGRQLELAQKKITKPQN